MGTVDEALVAGVGVRRGHETLLDTERIVEHLDHRHEAVGRARGVRHDDVLGRVERVVVDADHERGIDAFGRGRDDNAGRTTVDVGGSGVTLGEETGRLDDDVDAEVAPGEIGGVALRQHLQDVAVHRDATVDGLDRAREGAADRVALEQVGHRLQRAEVVDRDEVDVDTSQLRRPEEVAADPPEAVDTHTNAHCSPRH